MTRLLLTAVILLLGMCCRAHAMEFSVNKRNIYASGTIVDGDYERLVAFFRDKPPAVFVETSSFHLNSPGGSVTEALKLSRFVADTFRMTFVDGGKQCMSSCFFLFVSGGFRFREDAGVIGIHRPYMEKAKFAALSQADAARTYESIDSGTRKFLYSVRMPDVIVNKLFSTPSDQIYLLSDDELEQQVGFWQPWWEEMASAACAKELVRRLECMHQRSSLERVDLIPRLLGSAYAEKYASEITKLKIQVMSKVVSTSTGPLPSPTR